MTLHPALDADGVAMQAVQDRLPIALAPYALNGQSCGLVIVDEVVGFALPGAGPLAPPAHDAQVERMVNETDGLARQFVDAKRPILAFLDTHEPGKLEPPYPPHCEKGSGHEELVPQLAWLSDCPAVTLMRKDCINGFVGGIDQTSGGNLVVDWINRNRLSVIIVVGICTDICVMDFVLTMLSARNHDLTPTLKDIVVYEPGCATYHLPKSTALDLGLPETAAHPQALAHHLGLYFMASRGAIIAQRLS